MSVVDFRCDLSQRGLGAVAFLGAHRVRLEIELPPHAIAAVTVNLGRA